MSNYKITVVCVATLVATAVALAALSLFAGAYPLEYMPNISAEDVLEYKVHVDTFWSGHYKILNTWVPLIFVSAMIIMTWSLSRSHIPPVAQIVLSGWFVWISYIENLWLKMATSIASPMFEDPMQLERNIAQARHYTSTKGIIALVMCVAVFEGWLRRKRPKPPPPPPPEKKGKKK